MPQDSIKDTGREAEARAKTSLAKRDYFDLRIVRRRLQDSVVVDHGQQVAFAIIPPEAIVFLLDTVERLLTYSEVE